MSGEFRKQSLTQYGMSAKLGEIAKETGYIHEDHTIHPTDKNIKVMIDYQYHKLFVPMDVVEEAEKEFPWFPEKKDVEGKSDKDVYLAYKRNVHAWARKWLH